MTLSRLRRKYKITTEDYKLILGQLKHLAYTEGVVDGEILALYKKVRNNMPCAAKDDLNGINPDSFIQEWAILYLKQFEDNTIT